MISCPAKLKTPLYAWTVALAIAINLTPHATLNLQSIDPHHSPLQACKGVLGPGVPPGVAESVPAPPASLFFFFFLRGMRAGCGVCAVRRERYEPHVRHMLSGSLGSQNTGGLLVACFRSYGNGNAKYGVLLGEGLRKRVSMRTRVRLTR